MTLRKLLVGFNLSLLLTLLLSVGLPWLLLGSGASGYFQNNIIGIGIMLISFIAINIYFACNWSLFNSLEKGDWYSLHVILRSKIFEGKQYSRQNIFYFIEVAIQLNNLELLRELYEELQLCSAVLQKFGQRQAPNKDIRGILQVARQRPWAGSMRWYRQHRREMRLARTAEKRLCDFAIEFGLPHLIEDPGQDSEQYFGDLREFPAFQQARYNRKYKWSELFYAIALLVQGKYRYAASLLEQLLLSPETTSEMAAAGQSYRPDSKAFVPASDITAAPNSSASPALQGASRRERDSRRRGLLRDKAIQDGEKGEAKDKIKFAEMLNLREILYKFKMRRNLRKNALLQLVSIQLLEDLHGNLNNQQVGSSFIDAEQEPLIVDQQLIDLRRAEIQKLYDSPKHWSSYLLKEQNRNIAIAMIRQLISSAYDKQLRPTHQAYLADLESRNKASKLPLSQQHSSYHR